MKPYLTVRFLVNLWDLNPEMSGIFNNKNFYLYCTITNYYRLCVLDFKIFLTMIVNLRKHKQSRQSFQQPFKKCLHLILMTPFLLSEHHIVIHFCEVTFVLG